MVECRACEGIYNQVNAAIFLEGKPSSHLLIPICNIVCIFRHTY